jgi:hypothetical protein
LTTQIVVNGLLPHLAKVAKDARITAGLTYAHIAVHVQKRNGREGVSDSTVARFEYGKTWPENPDAMLAAYGAACDLDPRELWHTAIAASRETSSARARKR